LVAKQIENNKDLLFKAVSRVENWAEETAAAIVKTQNSITAVKTEIKDKQDKASRDATELAEVEAEIKQVVADLEEAKKLDAGVKALQKELTAKESKLAVAKSNLVDAGTKVKKTQAEFDRASEKIGKPCEKCGKEVCEEDLETVLEAIRDSLGKAAAGYREAKEAVSKAESERNEAFSKHEAESAKIKSIPTMIARAEFLVAKKKSLMMAPDNIKILEAKLEGLETTLNNLKTSGNPYESSVEDLEKVIDGGEAAKADIDTDLDRLEKELLLAQEVVNIYGTAGVRAHILDHVTPFLNTRTAYYLDLLTDGNITAIWSTIKLDSKGEYKEKFNIQVKSNTGGHMYALLSGGEKRKVRIATSLALQDLIASRATKPFNLFIADEIDDALDESGMERLMTLLEELSKTRGTVIVISHNELSKWIPNRTVVTKSGGKATITGSLCS
jgi:DNA repair exonuclease SbcCD ATPase subunit